MRGTTKGTPDKMEGATNKTAGTHDNRRGKHGGGQDVQISGTGHDSG